VSTLELNRWTLLRQHLLERAPLDRLGVAGAVDALAGMQAQHAPSPYIGLWSRLAGFRRSHLEAALADDEVVKATVMRGTLHLVAAARLPHYRVASGSAYYEQTFQHLRDAGVDLDAIRARVVATVAARPHTRVEVARLVAGLLPADLGDLATVRPSAVAAVSVASDLVNLAEDAAFGYYGGSRYRVAPAGATAAVDPGDAMRAVVAAYLGAYGPASPADLSQWSGRPAGAFAPSLAALDLVEMEAEDGRRLVDLAGAPRPAVDDLPRPPVRFLPKWDSLLLAHARRERVIADDHRRVVIARNGDVAPTFLVGGVVAGTWEATRRGPAVIRLWPLTRIGARDRRAVESEGALLLSWLRPEAPDGQVRWEERSP
jgi:hypothetical protein